MVCGESLYGLNLQKFARSTFFIASITRCVFKISFSTKKKTMLVHVFENAYRYFTYIVK